MKTAKPGTGDAAAIPHPTSALYDAIGSRYVATRRADPDIVARLVDGLALESNKRYLDVACGTGNYTSALASRGGGWVGIDVSEVMLKAARRQHPELALTLGDVGHLPYGTGSFDGAVCTLALHHFNDLAASFAEVRRIIRSGRFVIFTGLAEQMKSYWLRHYFPQMMARSSESMPSSESVVTALQAAGFDQVEQAPFIVGEALQDLFLYSGKHRPAIYLDPVVRGNISSFARLCGKPELRTGLDRLAKDMASGEFERVAASYCSSSGDYAFFIATARA